MHSGLVRERQGKRGGKGEEEEEKEKEKEKEKENQHTKQPTKMLHTINIPRIPFPLPHAPDFPFRPGVPSIIILLSLKLIKQNPAQTFVKVILHAAHHFFEQIRLGAAGAAFNLLFGKIGVEDGVDGVWRREGEEGQGFGDGFPVVD